MNWDGLPKDPGIPDLVAYWWKEASKICLSAHESAIVVCALNVHLEKNKLLVIMKKMAILPRSLFHDALHSFLVFHKFQNMMSILMLYLNSTEVLILGINFIF